MQRTTYVDMETARTAPGMRLVVVSGIPSPWSESAKGLFQLKSIPFVCVRLGPTDKEVRAWTRSRNAPVAMWNDEPGRTGWAEILELTERIAPSPSLVPKDPEVRTRMFGLAHELMGDGGLLWSSRLLTIHIGLETGGERGFPPMVGEYLGKRYGYTKDRIELARQRVREGWALLEEALGDRPYFFGELPTALDIYCATAVNLFELLPEEDCPMLPLIRHAFASVREEFAFPPPAIVSHRDRMYAQHLERPIAF